MKNKNSDFNYYNSPGVSLVCFPLKLLGNVSFVLLLLLVSSAISGSAPPAGPAVGPEMMSDAMGQSYLMPVPTVRVFLFSFDRGPLLPITDTPNSDVVITKAPGYFEAYMFECNATFPIQWSYVGEGAPIMTADVGRQFTNFYDSATYMYQAAMIMFALEEQNSGRYVCRGIETQHQKISTYLHLYVPGSNILVSTSEKAVQVPPYKDQVTIPCSVSDPTAVVNLYKGNHKGVYKRVETNSSIVFNPRKGFRIARNLLQDPLGKYLCIADINKRRVKINLIPKGIGGYERKKRQEDGQRHKRQAYGMNNQQQYGVAEPLQISYDDRYHRMLCCSASGTPPKLSYAGCTSIVDCEIKSACFREGRCEGREEGKATSNYYNKYIGLDPPGCSGHALRSDPNGDMGLFLCQDTSTSAMIYQPFQLNRGNLFLSFQEAPLANQVMSLNRATSEELFVGSETQFRCNSSRFFFGFGVRWAFERTNGDLEFVADDDVVGDAYFIANHRRHTTLKIPDAEVKSVVCAAPVWNSPTEWRMLSLPISVSRVFRPPTTTTAAPPRAELLVARPQYGPPNEYARPRKIPYGPASENRLRQRILPLVPTTVSSAEESPALLPTISYETQHHTQQPYILTDNNALIHEQQQQQQEYLPAAPQHLQYVPYNPSLIPNNPEALVGHPTSSQYYYTAAAGSLHRVRRKLKKSDSVKV